ncbi:MAG: hypothetical protein C0596_15975 [Marinilabiliales bacterium]|nr:MAG: hypothetical protein C0596_15975 [Marinilabiliales bacterium]
MAEWSNAAVFKTVDLHGSGGSNPSFSAKRKSKVKQSPEIQCFQDFFFLHCSAKYRKFRAFA